MWIRRMLRFFAVLASAFVLTSAAMFWLPALEGPKESRGWWVPISATPVYEYSGGNAFPDAESLKNLSPIEERFSLDDIVSELRQKSNVELFNLKAFDNVCANGLVDCRGLASTNIKPFIDAILSDRQVAETAFYYRTTNIIAGGSLFISFIALIFAGLTYFRRHPSNTG